MLFAATSHPVAGNHEYLTGRRRYRRPDITGNITPHDEDRILAGGRNGRRGRPGCPDTGLYRSGRPRPRDPRHDH